MAKLKIFIDFVYIQSVDYKFRTETKYHHKILIQIQTGAWILFN